MYENICLGVWPNQSKLFRLRSISGDESVLIRWSKGSSFRLELGSPMWSLWVALRDLQTQEGKTFCWVSIWWKWSNPEHTWYCPRDETDDWKKSWKGSEMEKKFNVDLFIKAWNLKKFPESNLDNIANKESESTTFEAFWGKECRISHLLSIEYILQLIPFPWKSSQCSFELDLLMFFLKWIQEKKKKKVTS